MTEIVGGYTGDCNNPFIQSTPTGPGTFAVQDVDNIGTIGSLKSKTVRFQPPPIEHQQ